MRAMILTAAMLGAVGTVWPDGPVRAQTEIQSPSDSSCTGSAAPDNRPPAVDFQASARHVGATPDRTVTLNVDATDPDGDALFYSYSFTGGRFIGVGSSTAWDLSDAQPRTYTVTIVVDDGRGCSTFRSLEVSVDNR